MLRDSPAPSSNPGRLLNLQAWLNQLGELSLLRPRGRQRAKILVPRIRVLRPARHRLRIVLLYSVRRLRQFVPRCIFGLQQWLRMGCLHAQQWLSEHDYSVNDSGWQWVWTILRRLEYESGYLRDRQPVCNLPSERRAHRPLDELKVPGFV